MRYYVCCILVGVGLAQGFEAMEAAQEYPPVALCPNYDTLIVAVNPWRIGSPTRTIVPTCDVLPPRMTNAQPVAPREDTTDA
jgi:hypothetical protein